MDLEDHIDEEIDRVVINQNARREDNHPEDEDGRRSEAPEIVETLKEQHEDDNVGR
jgi:hypothetical protein